MKINTGVCAYIKTTAGIWTQLLKEGYTRIAVGRYNKRTPEGLYMTISTCPYPVTFILRDQAYSEVLIHNESHLQEFDKAYAKFKQQCEMLNTIALFNNEN
jgi:hypothetical protein